MSIFKKYQKLLNISATLALITTITLFVGNKVMSDLQYPYIATEQRQSEILNGVKKITIGMTEKKVTSIMGAPDEVHDLFLSKKDAKPVGKTYWYLLKRDRENGSFAEKGENLVRLSFDLGGTLTAIDQW